MKYLISIQSKNLYGCLIDSEQEEYMAFWRFMLKFYPTIIHYSEVNEGEFRPTLRDKAFSGDILIQGELEARTEIGLFKIEPFNALSLPDEYITITGGQIIEWVAKERLIKDAEYINHSENKMMEQAYLHNTPEMIKFHNLGYYTNNGWQPNKHFNR